MAKVSVPIRLTQHVYDLLEKSAAPARRSVNAHAAFLVEMMLLNEFEAPRSASPIDYRPAQNTADVPIRSPLPRTQPSYTPPLHAPEFSEPQEDDTPTVEMVLVGGRPHALYSTPPMSMQGMVEIVADNGAHYWAHPQMPGDLWPK
jgi:hypothetical protein